MRLKALFVRHGRSDAMAYLIGSEIYGELRVVGSVRGFANEISGIVIEKRVASDGSAPRVSAARPRWSGGASSNFLNGSRRRQLHRTIVSGRG